MGPVQEQRRGKGTVDDVPLSLNGDDRARAITRGTTKVKWKGAWLLRQVEEGKAGGREAVERSTRSWQRVPGLLRRTTKPALGEERASWRLGDGWMSRREASATHSRERIEGGR